jgi:hypothetical protein
LGGSDQFKRGKVVELSAVDLNFWEEVAVLHLPFDDPKMKKVRLNAKDGFAYNRFAEGGVKVDKPDVVNLARVVLALCEAPLVKVLPALTGSKNRNLLYVCQNWPPGVGLMLGEAKKEGKARLLWRDPKGDLHLYHEQILPLVKRRVTGDSSDELKCLMSSDEDLLVKADDPYTVQVDWKELDANRRKAKTLRGYKSAILAAFIDNAWASCPVLTGALSWSKPGILCFELRDEEDFNTLVQDWCTVVQRCEAAVKPGNEETPEGREIVALVPGIDFATGLRPRFDEQLVALSPMVCVIDAYACEVTPLKP